jgi:hypothetical protein
MLSNLKTIIIANYEHEVPEFVLNINNAVPSNSGKTKRPFQSKQKKIIVLRLLSMFSVYICFLFS